MDKRSSNIAKGIGVLMLLAHHLFYSTDSILQKTGGVNISFYPFSSHQIIQLSLSFKICVSIFVFITGYGLYRQLDSKDFSQGTELFSYSLSRLIKLYGGYWIVFILAHFVGIFLYFTVSSDIRTFQSIYGGSGAALGLKYFIIDFFGLANLFGTPTYNATWWYMSLAITLIFLVPVLFVIGKKVGIGSLTIFSFVLPLASGWELGKLWRYAFVLSLGMLFAEQNLFERAEQGIKTLRGNSKVNTGLIILLEVTLVLFLLFLQRRFSSKSIPWGVEALAAVLCCHISSLVSRSTFSAALHYLGVHSMNIFLIHTFIYSYFAPKLIYSFRWFALIYVVLLLSSILASLIVEKIKAVTGWTRCINSLAVKVPQVLSSAK